MAPWALAQVLPLDVVDEINETLIASRAGGRTWRWALSLIRRGLEWIVERDVRPDDRYEARSALLATHQKITALLQRWEQEESR
jgi:hypothetical protein